MAFTPFVSEMLLDVRRIVADCAVYRNIRQLHQCGRPSAIFPRRGTRPSAIRVRCGKCCAYWATLFDLKGLDITIPLRILKDALDAESLPSKLDNCSTWTGRGVQTASDRLVRVGGVGIYHTDPIVRRSAPLQETSHAAVPAARVNQTHWHAWACKTDKLLFAKQNGASVSVAVKADAGLPENVVHLPLHTENAALGALMDTIELAGLDHAKMVPKPLCPQRSVWAIWVLP